MAAEAGGAADADLLEGNGGSLADYEIEKPIGKGKFSVVYRGSRRADGARVALKKVAIFDMMDAKARDKCLKEVRLVQSLDHPNIIRYLDSFIENNELMIVFEWAEAGDLKRQIRKAVEREARFDERVIWKYFAQVCEAIHHMHTRRVMHRDLKPANIFLTLQGIVKVGDLGLGRHFSENTMEAHSKVGTPLYMSPEVLRGDGYDWKSDIWSLGCILYELAMLRSPFKSEGLNLYGLFQKISKGDFEPLPTHYSQELRQLAYQMVSVDPNERPTMDEVCSVARAMRERTQQQRREAKAAAAAAAAAAESAAPEPDDAKPGPSSEPGGASEPKPKPSDEPEDDDEPPPPQPTPAESKESKPADSVAGHVVVSCEELLLKLHLLDYHRDFLQGGAHKPLSYVHFAVPAAGRRRTNTKQFADAVALAAWLLRKLDIAFDAAIVEAQPANSVASQLLLALQDAGLPAAAAAAIPPSSLTPGFGSSVCATLNWLADQALARASFSFAPPVYANRDDADGEDVDGDGDPDAAAEQAEAEGAAEDGEALEVEPARVGMQQHVMPVLEPSVPAELWQEEAARAAPALAAARQRAAAGALGEDWRARLRAMRGVCGTWSECGLPAPDSGEPQAVCAQLETVAAAAHAEAEDVRGVERRVGEAAGPLRGEYAALAARLKEAEARHAAAAERVSSKSQALAEVADRADDARARIEQGNAAGTDDAPLRNIRDALQRLRDETGQLELRMGLVMARTFRGRPSSSSSSVDADLLDQDEL